MRLLPFALVLAVLAPPAVAAEPIGRLFYTPDQRASLDVARSKRARNVVATEKAEEAPPPPTPEVVTYGGIVRRSDGKTTVWLNNRAVSGKESGDAKMVGKIRPDGTVTLQSPQTGRSVDLKVGQRAELLSGRVNEGYRYTPAQKPEVGQTDPAAAKAADGAPAAEADRRKEAREQRDNLDEAIQALRDAASARSAGTAPPQPAAGALQQSGTPPPQVRVPGPPQATK